MIGYTIADKADRDTFEATCGRIEAIFPALQKEPALEDVDGTQIQRYHNGERTIEVISDYDVGCVAVDSDMELDIPHIRKYETSAK